MMSDKWTVVLAATGLLSLASVAKAEERAYSVLTAPSAKTLSGYVDTSAQWNFGTGNANTPPYRFGGASKADGFNLNVVQLRIEKSLDETEWAAGYRLDLWAGLDANSLGTVSTLATGASDFAIRQAYVSLRMPVGNGIEWKVGVFDSIIGYESIESPRDPNYTRSYGNTIEPTTHTGLLTSYRFSDVFSAAVGVADTFGPSINSRVRGGSAGFVSGIFVRYFSTPLAAPGQNAYAESYKTNMGLIALTAPDTTGRLAGSTLYFGAINGFNNSVFGSGVGMPQLNVYAGANVPTLVSRLRLGIAFDNADLATTFLGTTVDGSAWALAGYAS
jgi:hypothetical protein